MGQGGDPCSEAPIRFGTSGWRGILGDDFSFPRLRRVLDAVGRWLSAQGSRAEVIVGHDTRFLGERMAALAAAILHAHGQRRRRRPPARTASARSRVSAARERA